MRVRYFLLVMLATVLFSTLALADSTITTTPIKNQISLIEQASYELRIVNNEDVTLRYSLYSLQSGQGWSVEPSPLKDKIIQIDPGKDYTTIIQIDPLDDFSPGIYYVHVTVESDSGERHNVALKVYLGPEKPLDYLPVISVTTDMDEKINPQDPVSIKLFLENRNPLDLTGLKIRIQSEMPEFAKEVTVDLPPLEKKTVEFSITPNPYQQPKDYYLFFVFEKDGETAKIVEQKVEIVPLLPEFSVEEIIETIFFKKFLILSFTNEGNVLNTQDAKYPFSLWASLFTRGDNNIVVEDGVRYAAWELTLAPGESHTIYLTTNYRLIFYFLVLVLIVLIFYYSVQSPVAVRKTAVTTRTDGAVSGMKITLEVKNKSTHTLKHVNIIDMVPGIANVEKSLELGTLKPSQFKHTKKGTKVVWSLAELDAHEHRLITYKVKAKLNILGTLSLPRAIVTYRKRKRQRKSYSNVFRLGNDV